MSLTTIQQKMITYLDTYAKVWPMSLVALVGYKGEVIYSGAYGMADIENSIPHQLHTKFRIASISKPFTATATMLLQERGFLKVTDPISKYLPDYPEFDERITIHHLLSHTSGIFNFTDLPNFNKTTEKLYFTEKEFIGLFKDLPLNFAPGERWSYCNSGYYLLGVIIERVSGMPFTKFIKENILKPVGMENTDYDHESTILPGRSRGYVLNGANLINEPFVEMTKFYACGGLYSTVEDLFLFDQALHAGKIISQESLHSMFTPHTPHYGYGWDVGTKNNHKRVGHNGGLSGFGVEYHSYPDEQIFVAVFGNYQFQAVWKICGDLENIFFGAEVQSPKKPEPLTTEVHKYTDYVGVYRSPHSDFRVTVTSKDNKLFFQFGNDDQFEVYPYAPDTFNHIWIDEQYQFVRDGQGQISLWGMKRENL